MAEDVVAKNNTKQQEVYSAQLRNVLIALAGNATTLEPATSDKELHLLINIWKELRLRRLNQLFKEEIVARSQTCLPWFSIVDLSEEDYVELEKSFVKPESASKDALEALWR